MKKISNVGLSLFVLFSVFDFQCIQARNTKDIEQSNVIENSEAGIPDINLYEAVLKVADDNNDNILTKEEAERVIELNADNLGINTLKGIEFMPNLYRLSLSNNNLSDISHLKSLSHLDKLNLSCNQISDISPLENIDYLFELDLSNNIICNIESLKGLANFSDVPHNLNLSNNRISDISVLCENIRLENLDLSNNRISDTSSLSLLLRADSLNDLNLSNNNISELPDLTQLNIYSINLDFSLNKLSETELKEKMPYRFASDAEWINKNKYSAIAYDGIIKNDKTGIPDPNLYAKALEIADRNNDKVLEQYEINQVSCFSAINANITDLKGIELFKNLRELNLDHNNINDITEIKDLTKIIQLYLNYNNIEDISALKNLSELDELELSHNKLNNVMVLGNLKKLAYIKLNDNQISELPDLTKFNFNLAYSIDMFNNKLTEEELKKKMPGFYANDQEWIDRNKYVAPLVVKGLKADSIGRNKVKLTWEKTEGAEGYIIYRKIGNGKYQYRYMVKGTTYIDVTASGLFYNYYRVYPYYTKNGQRIIGESDSFASAKWKMKPISGLVAVTIGKNKVEIKWNKSEDADGYIIYRQIGNGKFEYRYMVKGTSFIDMTASGSEYNFYRIYPYYTENGERVLGGSNSYKYAKGVINAITNLKATSFGNNRVKLSWSKAEGAEGYIIYRKVGNGRFEYRYMVKGDSFVDTTASNTEYNFYRVYPYHTENGKRIIGLSNDYKYAKASMK